MAKPGSPEWQEELNRQIAEHDRQQKARDAKIDADLKAEAKRLADEQAKKDAENNK